MESSADNQNCLMCLVAPAVRTVGTCQHTFCEDCFTTHQVGDSSEERPCPACQRKGQNPDSVDGIELSGSERESRSDDSEEAMTSSKEHPGMTEGDVGEDSDASAGVSSPPRVKEAIVPFAEPPDALGDGNAKTGKQHLPCYACICGQVSSKLVLKDAKCVLCYHRGTTKQAANICEECKKLPLCGTCTDAHRTNRATQHHVVTALAPLASIKRDKLCEAHGEQLDLLCKTCSAAVCHVCVSLEHSDHDVETYIDIIHEDVSRLTAGLEFEKSRLETLQADEANLLQWKATGEDMEDDLIRGIEDHAEKCIEEILKNKEALKKRVRDDFKVVRVMTKRLQAMPDLLKDSKRLIAATTELLNEKAELNSMYVGKLEHLQAQLDQLKEGHPANEEDKAKYRQDYEELLEKAITFYPRMPNCKIGGFKDIYYAGPRCNDSGPCVCETCEKAFKWPDAERVVECRQKGTCACGTCGVVYNRKALTSDGLCDGTYWVRGIKGTYSCNEKITIGDQKFP